MTTTEQARERAIMMVAYVQAAIYRDNPLSDIDTEFWEKEIASALLAFRKEGVEKAVEMLVKIADEYGAIHPGMSTATSNRRDDYAAERALRSAVQAIRKMEE